jgi:hypothetical protein
MQKSIQVSRRIFLKVFVGFGLCAMAVAGVGHQFRRQLYRRYLQLRLDESLKPGTLSEGEFQVIQALFEVISSRPPPSPGELLEFVNWRTSMTPGYYQEYKSAVELLEARSRTRFDAGFATLSEEMRDGLLREVLPWHTLLPLQETLPAHEAEPSLVGKFRILQELFFYHTEARFKYFVFWDLLRFYWLSSAGWAAVGYTSYAGVPDPHRTYTSALHRRLSVP